MTNRWIYAAVLVLTMLVCTRLSAAPRSDLNLWVVEASTVSGEKPFYDEGLEEIFGVLATLPHNTYKKVSSGKHGLAVDESTRVAMDSDYTLEASAPADAPDGRYRVRFRILMKSNEKVTPPKEIEALSTELLLRPEKKVLVRGLKLKNGSELILVLSLSLAAENNTAR